MIIQKMNNVLVKHGKITFAVFTILIIVSFVLYVGSTSLFELVSGPRSVSAGSKYGEVLEQDFSYDDLDRARSVVSTFGAAIYASNRFRTPDYDMAAVYAIMIKASEALNIQVSDKEVETVICAMPMFQTNGKFSKEKFDEYQEKCLTPNGVSGSAFDEIVRTMIRMIKLPKSEEVSVQYFERFFLDGEYLNYIFATGLYLDFMNFYKILFEGSDIQEMFASNVILTEGELEASLETMLQKITFNMITFNPEAFADQVKIEDSEVRDYYTAHTSDFMSEPQSDGLLAFAPFTVTKNEVSDERVKEHYEANKDEYVSFDGTQLPFDDVKDVIRAQLETTVESESAIEKAQAFNKSIRALVKDDKDAYQADPQKFFRAEAEKAGLQIIPIQSITPQMAEDAGRHLDVELIEAATILKNPGSNTNLIKGKDGVAMFLLTARRPSVVQPFDDVKEIAQQRLLAQKEYALAEEAAAQLGVKFAEIRESATPAMLEELVKSLHGEWHAENTVHRIDVEERRSSPGADEILSTEPGMLSAPDKRIGYPVLVYVRAHTPATVEEIADGKAHLESELKARKQSAVRNGMWSWVIGTVKTIDRGRNQN